MVKTFTPQQDFIVSQTEKEKDPLYLEHAEPSAKTIQAILNYSKNLEIQSSELLSRIEFIKS